MRGVTVSRMRERYAQMVLTFQITYIIRIMMDAHRRTSCRKLFKKIRDFNSPKPIYIYTH